MNVMKRAHELCLQGVSQFGGTCSEYMSESLRIAHSELKTVKSRVVSNPVSFAKTVLCFLTFVFIFAFIGYDDPTGDSKMSKIQDKAVCNTFYCLKLNSVDIRRLNR